jgi:4-amino-4-deoxy-L-arabinose transferase-like glycosyltransferase
MKISFPTFFKKQYLLLFVIILIGAFLRLTGVFTNSFAFTYDVGRDLLAVNQIIHTLKIPLIGATTGMEGVFYGPWWYYLLIIPFIIVQGDPSGISLFMALLGVVTVFLSFLVGKKIGGNLLGLILAALISFSPATISNQIWNPYMAWPFMMLLFYFVAQSYGKDTKRRSLSFLLIGLCLGFVFDAEIFFGMLFCIGTFLGLIITLRKSFKIKCILSLIGGFLIVLAPRIVFDLRHQFLISSHFLYTLTHGIPQTHYTPFLSRISMLKDLFWGIWLNTLTNNIVWVGVLLLIATIFLLLFSFKKANKLEKNFIILCLTILLTFFVYFSTNSTDIFSHYLIGIPLVLLFIFALVLSQTAHIGGGKIIVTVLLMTVLCIYLSPRQISKSFDYSFVGDDSVYKNALAVVNYVYQQADGRQFTTEVFTPNGINYTYRYLFLWDGAKKHYLPINKAKLVYFIVEPDTQYDNYRQRIWLDEHKNDGRIVKTKMFPSGVIVQTRIH